MPAKPKRLSNAAIAARLMEIARALPHTAENRYKARAYERAADHLTVVASSLAQEVEQGADLTRHPGVGKGIAAAIREIVTTGKAPAKATRRSRSPEPKHTAGVQILLYDADSLVKSVRDYLLGSCGCTRVDAVGAYRRRVEVIDELSFLVETDDFDGVLESFQEFSGGVESVEASPTQAVFALGNGVRVRLTRGVSKTWGLAQVLTTGSATHLQALQGPRRLDKVMKTKKALGEEADVYEKMGLAYIPPELREGLGEVAQAAKDRIPRLVEVADIRGELHAHTTSSDGAHTILQMAEAALEKGYAYLGITDHSQSLKIAGGVTEADLRKQLRAIDKLNSKLRGLRILKSAEVDILADGSLDYPDELLAQLDYTVCSIHSRFALNKEKQTERVLRAMDNPYFGILGHSTGRLLLRRSGYEIDLGRIIKQAKATGCCFEINCSPDRLDLGSEAAREVAAAGIPIAICTDAHRIPELDWMRNGIDVARRAGLTRSQILNTRDLPQLLKALRGGR